MTEAIEVLLARATASRSRFGLCPNAEERTTFTDRPIRPVYFLPRLPKCRQISRCRPATSSVKLMVRAARPQRQDVAAMRLPSAKEILFVLLPLDDRLDVRPVAAPQIVYGQVAAGDRPGEDSAREVLLADLPLPRRHQVADPSHALRPPHDLSKNGQLRPVKCGRAHEVHGRRDHHVHVVRRVEVVLDEIEHLRILVQKPRIAHHVEELPVVEARAAPRTPRAAETAGLDAGSHPRRRS